MSEISSLSQWGSRFKVDGSSWTPGDFKGDFLLDAMGTRFLIIGNTADTLYLSRVTAPNRGTTVKYSSPGWTPGQYAQTPTVSSVYVPSAGRFPIIQSTVDTLVLEEKNDPTPSAAAIYQGGARVLSLSASPTVGNGYWQIVEADGTAVDDSDSNTGAVTSTPGGGLLPAAVAVPSLAFDLRGISTFSLVAGFFDGVASSPNGALAVQVNNRPIANANGSENSGPVGPDQNDPAWTTIKVSADGAALATSVTINDANPHAIVPSMHPNSPVGYVRWGRTLWTPAESPGTGNLSVFWYGWGM